MMFRLRRLMAVLLSLPLTASGQDSLRTGSFFRVETDNDVYQRRHDITDRYYTNGLRLTLLSNYWHRWPTRYLLPTFRQRPGRSYDRLYDFTLGQDTYTPRDIQNARFRDRPAYYDRPYAGHLFAAWGSTVSDSTAGRKLTTAFSVGVIGPLSLAAESQSGLHKIIDDPQPIGWDKQIKNDLSIGYYARYEGRPMGRLFRELDLIGAVEGNVGTFTNYAGTSLMLRFGRFNDYFQNATGLYDPHYRSESRMSGRQRRFQFYTFLRPAFRAVLTNASLQGGLLNRSREPYALPSSQLRHRYAQIEWGGVIGYRGFQFAYTIIRRGREHDSGDRQQWGRIATLWRW